MEPLIRGTIKGAIEFDNVSFWYEEDDQVLTDFSLKVKRGETIALVDRLAAERQPLSISYVVFMNQSRVSFELVTGTTLITHCTPSNQELVLSCKHRICSQAQSNRTLPMAT